ncbi:hypothetical protein [Chelativorans sp.]|uniref:hypothetical protein n=1 Tax=Chelativorans sp. TaxID=2203393 RepID=UPI002811D8C4|nr:hypothetical protein [Chelativorans sp.]
MRALIALMLMTGAAASDQDAANEAGFRLATAYHCIPVTGDSEAYAAAKEHAHKLLGSSAAEMIAAVEAQQPNADGKLTKPLCDDLIRSLSKEPVEELNR